MKTWTWLYQPARPFDWRFVRRVAVKTLALFVVFNLLLVAFDPLPVLGRLSAYNLLFPGRERLPYGENPDVAYNLSLFQLEAMFASHRIAQAKVADEFRVILIGDSSVWGVLLRPEETLAGRLDAVRLQTADGRVIRVYNLGYPTMSLTKDLLLLDMAMDYDPDLIVWLFTLESFDSAYQLDSALLQHNAGRVRRLIRDYDLRQNPDDDRFVEETLSDRTIWGRRRAFADMIRLQLYGVAWAVTGIDQAYPDDYTPRAVDLPADDAWHGLTAAQFSASDLAFDVLRAGVRRAGDVPVVLVNEPTMFSQGENSAIRYNAFYPRWAYDRFRAMLEQESDTRQWDYHDLGAILPDADCYTDSAVHLTPACAARLADRLAPLIVARAGG